MLFSYPRTSPPAWLYLPIPQLRRLGEFCQLRTQGGLGVNNSPFPGSFSVPKQNRFCLFLHLSFFSLSSQLLITKSKKEEERGRKRKKNGPEIRVTPVEEEEELVQVRFGIRKRKWQVSEVSQDGGTGVAPPTLIKHRQSPWKPKLGTRMNLC